MGRLERAHLRSCWTHSLFRSPRAGWIHNVRIKVACRPCSASLLVLLAIFSTGAGRGEQRGPSLASSAAGALVRASMESSTTAGGAHGVKGRESTNVRTRIKGALTLRGGMEETDRVLEARLRRANANVANAWRSGTFQFSGALQFG